MTKKETTVREKLELFGNSREEVMAGFISQMTSLDYTGEFIGERVAILMEVFDKVIKK